MTPTVSILLPVFNEAAHIAACLESLLAQDYPALVEILIADGGSDDGTLDLVAARAPGNPPVRVVANPERLQSYGLNRLIAVARGTVAVRADAHTTYASDYVRCCIAALETSQADLVGGPMRPEGVTETERAVAAAMTSPFGVGVAPFRRSTGAGEVDTVYLGAGALATLRRHGGYRHFPSGVAEDADLAYRIRKAGGRVWLDPAIRSSYRPRATLRAVWRQFRRYGRGKAEMLYVNGEFPSWRPLAPLLFIAAVLTGAALGVAGLSWWPLAGLLTLWLAALGVGSARSDSSHLRTAMAIATMQIAYGLGLAAGLLRGRPAIAAMRGTAPPRHASAEDEGGNPEERQSGE